jgi:hypothetical protein
MSSPSPDPAIYERGDALDEVVSRQQTGDGRFPPGRAEGDEEARRATVYELSEDEYWEWLAALMEDGSALDEALDDLLEEVYDSEPPFYSPAGRRRLRNLLRRLHEVRTSVRAFERDVEQLTFVFARTDTLEAGSADNAELVLASIKRTYDRAYDLCLYKLDRMSDGWITATNVLISLTILVVTILFWMEFW